ncbi:unnamed protein product [Candidula unifasciata]|uniref:G-protein coupled receptors family 1 profile domain-containing protein n=1 Tax=Candidula unifasciata TaxID=100452 RepID=A0A8S3YUV0_9EUPU|nr:unnamed protein product [Candidula unifasciata]
MSSYDVDTVAIDYVNKGLTIGFIVGIFGANCSLIYRIIRKGEFFNTPQSLTLISLAIGDIFLALLPLVVKAIYLFKVSEEGIPCSTNLAVIIYMCFLIHFVYAAGLVVLAIELIYKYRTQTSSVQTKKSTIKTIACSAFPWTLALVVVLPLMLAGLTEKSSSCTAHLTVQILQAAYGVSVLLPAIAAIVMCVIVLCVRFPSAYYTSPAVSYQVTEQANFVSPQSMQMMHQHHVVTNPMGNAQYPVGGAVVVHQFPVDNTGPQEPPGIQENNKQDPNLAGPTPTAPFTQYPVQQYSLQQYPGSQQYLGQQQYSGQQQYPMQQYPVTQFPSQQYIIQPNVVIAAPVYSIQTQNTTGSLADPGREKKVLLLVSIIHFICVVPYAVYMLGSNIEGYSVTFVDLIINLSLSWLSVFRSLITPCIFVTLNK